MRNTQKSSRRSGFTLVELLVVIAIIGILAAVIIPQVTGAIERANQTAGINSARELFKAYQNYQLQKGPILLGTYNATNAANRAANHGDFGLILSKEGYIDSAMYFYSKGDTGVPTPLPAVAAYDNAGTWTVNTAFSAGNISFEIALGIGIATTNSQVPALWSRGLQTDGTWPVDGPYGTKGGILTRLNGSVVFVSNLSEAQPPVYQLNASGTLSQTVTTNIANAIPTAATIGIIGKPVTD
jgi:prepilin-type N-terminal cleavage/methylation domain-containing protein